MRGVIATVLALVSVSACVAKDTPISVKVGKLCVIRADSRVSFLPASPPTWEMSIHDGGQTCVLSTEKPQTVVLFGIHGSVEGAPPEIDRWIVTIGDGDAPAPGPDDPVDPVDPVDPIDSLVPDKWSMGKFAFAEAAKVKDKAGAENAYRIWGGAYKKMLAIDQSLPSAQQDEIHDSIWRTEVQATSNKYLSAKWSTWRNAMQERFQKSENEGKFPTVRDTADAMLEVSTALRILARGK